MDSATKLIGPFTQIVTLVGLPATGPIGDAALEIISDGGVLIENGHIVRVDAFEKLVRVAKSQNTVVHETTGVQVLLPGLVDCHTHICFAGSRVHDYALRVAGTSYLDIAKQGGGILDTVVKTRAASEEELVVSLAKRCDRHLADGVTTCEVKSGYGLTITDELKILHAIQKVSTSHAMSLVPTCLAAHVKPKEYTDGLSYLKDVVTKLLPEVKNLKLASRVDIFIEDTAFTVAEAKYFLSEARKMGFDIVVHADQFGAGGSHVAAEFNAVSADHLETVTDADLAVLAKASVTAVVLPGASLGLGVPFAPARKILDKGLALAIASDWNPGTAPMGDLLMQASVLGAAQKLTLAETFAGITTRAARALKLSDRGEIAAGKTADLIAFETDDWREIFYQQGRLKPARVWKAGALVL